MEITQVLLQLLLAVLLGALVGLEREYKKKEAGLQTYSLVSLGACIFTLIALGFLPMFEGRAGIETDPARIIQSIATGIGFIGAGVIIYKKAHIEGITTAAGLWATAAIGVAIGAQFYTIAIISAFLITVILIAFGEIERKIF